MDEVIFLGCVTYISTKQPVKLSLCENISKALMDKGEEISEAARDSVFMSTGNTDQEGQQELLTNMMYLTMIDHMISNHEYENMIENHLHYLMGRNEKAVSYIDQVGENNDKTIEEGVGIMKQFDADSKLIFMLSEIVGRHRN